MRQHAMTLGILSEGTTADELPMGACDGLVEQLCLSMWMWLGCRQTRGGIAVPTSLLRVAAFDPPLPNDGESEWLGGGGEIP